jgi:uncharacterized membrane protein YeaQ/YmgE (transglycosylase-associated protein family)
MLERFMNLPVIVETPAGPVVGVLVRADTSGHGGIGSLLIHAFIGSWVLVKAWTAIKTARSST